VYIAEISPKKLRGRFVSFNSVALSSGLLVRIQPLLTRLAKIFAYVKCGHLIISSTVFTGGNSGQLDM